jgi:maltose alpha-D-glucosyltransferase/alpha-amylase
VQEVLAAEEAIIGRFQFLLGPALKAVRTRHHGDLHLGQVLYAEADFYFIDFEGEPARPLGERRLKRSPLVDVAGVLRSFDYATHFGLTQAGERGLEPEEVARLGPWAGYWVRLVSATYLGGYLETAGRAPFIPADIEDLHHLLSAHMLEKALYELGYELNNRPEWVRLPIEGILGLLNEG